jgi:predicted helicase
LKLKNSGQLGRWTTYVHNDLLPRLHGFELMMAPYTIAHLKLSMAFKATGFKYFNRRLGIYLTNSLEESEPQQGLFTGFGFAESIAEESKEAALIKNETPIMVVIGNPPYSISSRNKGKWILQLITEYKKNLNEKKINIDDDYIKFIRLAEHYVERKKTGIVAMITNNSFLSGVTHRQMRKHLVNTFNDIYIIDLHGDSNRQERSPDGSRDVNVFDIQQGVAISLFVKNNKTDKTVGNVFHIDVFGTREHKFKMLNEVNLKSIHWKILQYSDPYFFFVPKNFDEKEEYEKGFKVDELYLNYNTGIQTKRDNLTIQFNNKAIEQVRDDLMKLGDNEIRRKYNLPADGRDWKLSLAKKDLMENKPTHQLIFYRPFDIRHTLYTGKTKGFHAYPRAVTSDPIILGNNISLIMVRLNGEKEKYVVLLTNHLVEKGSLASGNYSFFPLYVYTGNNSKIPNLKKEIVEEIEKIVGRVTPEDIFDYIYAVLHSPSYREKYKEFLKIDFPRVPYPKDKQTFTQLVKFGTELRLLHLLESPKVNQFITTYPVPGDNEVEKVRFEKEVTLRQAQGDTESHADLVSASSKETPKQVRGDAGKVYINKEQYFGNVPEIAWNFFIGGYQPAQKWLKDRKGRTLTNTDIEHYQKIIVALVETDRIMKEIDKIKIIG